MTEDQEFMLKRIGSVDEGKWCYSPIDRSGGSKRYTAARQQLAKKGLIIGNPYRRRAWRVTDAGRAAILALEKR